MIVVTGEFSHQLVKAPDKFESRQGLLDFLNELLLTEGATLFASSAADELLLRGRWQPLRLLAGDAPDPIVFTDVAPDGVTEFAYRRDDLTFADGEEEFVNSVQASSKYLTVTVTDQLLGLGYPRVQLSRTDLITIRQGWVEANNRMWMTLYNQTRPYPRKLKFLVASRGVTLPTVYDIVAPDLSFDRQYQVKHTPPGTTVQITYRLAVDSIEHDIDRQRWQCTLGFTSLDRWWFGYGNGTDPIELIEIGGDADHGIGSEAIIAP